MLFEMIEIRLMIFWPWIWVWVAQIKGRAYTKLALFRGADVTLRANHRIQLQIIGLGQVGDLPANAVKR